MDDTPINLELILEQAPNWNFAGDFTLLQWMKQISENLENRAKKTTEALAYLDNNIRLTNIALHNVSNSLTTLQFGNQFVECRVHDDDETLVNPNHARQTRNQPEQATPCKEMLNIFLDNNLKVLRKCHEKYSIYIDDSDDEENSDEKTCIYHPINPYSDKPLPFIFGSQDWHSKWHVGLYENHHENSYSGDEISEAFSESSSPTHLDDNASFESNTEWASNTSIDNNHLNENLEINNASSLRGSQPISINAIRSESSTSSSVKKTLQTKQCNENLTQTLENINSFSSKTAFKTTAQRSPHNKENTVQCKTQAKKLVDLFAEPVEYLKSTSSSVSSASNIVRENNVLSIERPTAARIQPPPFVDLFAEPPEDLLSSTTSSLSSSHNIKRTTVNLFDEAEDNIEGDLLSISAKHMENKTLYPSEATITNKPLTSTSLFESDEDDDFLKAFLKKSLPKEASKRFLTKTLLFDDVINEPTTSSNSLLTVQNVFNDSEGKEDDLLFSKTRYHHSKIPIQYPKMDDVSQAVKTSAPVTKLLEKYPAGENVAQSVNLFNDFDDVRKISNLNSIKMSTKINLFDDLDDDDDLFSTKSKYNPNAFQQTIIKDVREASSSLAIEDKSIEIMKDPAATKYENSEKLTKNQLTNTCNLQSNNNSFIINENNTVDQEIISEISDNKVDTESFLFSNKLHAEEKANHENRTELKNESNTNISVPIMQDTLASVRENVTQQLSSPSKYDFNSILFLDEPPEDDNEFFATLVKTPSTLRSNYNAIDLENDIYEPELPKEPNAGTSNLQVDTPENFYTGLQLFSDIPPDDTGVSDSPSLPQDFAQTKRVHSIFYDDFSETLMALNHKRTKEEIPNHICTDEPPPINRESNSTTTDIDLEEIDENQEVPYTDHNTESLGIVSKIKEAVYKAGDDNTNEFSNKRPVSKLQMTHININVQALLPGANNTLRKAKEDDSSKSKILNSCLDDRTGKTDHILPNVTKNRVKASTARRPSTRRARQENYRKSLIEQQQSLGSDNESNENQTEKSVFIKSQVRTNIPHTPPTLVQPNILVGAHKQNLKDQITDNVKTNPANVTVISPVSKFNDKNEINQSIVNDTNGGDLRFKDNVFNTTEEMPKYLESSSLVQNIKPRTRSLLFNEKGVDDSLSSLKQVNSINESHGEDAVKLKFEQQSRFVLSDDGKEDDDFFKHIKTPKILDSKIGTNPEEYKAKESTKFSSETCESNVASPSSVHLANNTNTKVATGFKVSPSLDEESIVVMQSLTTKEECENQKLAKDDKNVHNKSEANKQLSTNTFKSILDNEDNTYDSLKIISQQQTRSTSNKDIIKKAKSQFKSFLDTENDEDVTVAGLQATTPKQLANVSSMIISKVSIRTKKKTHAKLFSDSDSESDDLFGKLSSTKAYNNIIPTQAKAQPQSTLFGDDSDSDGFLTSSRSISKTTASKINLKVNVPKTTTQANASLFSDLNSDEDDLFCGGAVKVTTPNVNKMAYSGAPSTYKSTASEAEISKFITIDDNPLADLL